MPSTKRIEASVLLDTERYEQLKAYQARKGLADVSEAVSLIVNTGLSRQNASDRYQAKQTEARKAAGGRARKKAEPKVAKAAKSDKAPKAAKTKAKAAGKGKAKKVNAKARGDAKPKSDTKIAAKKRVAKAEGASAAKTQPVKKVAKSNATVGRIVPQRPGPAASPSNGGIPPTTTNEVAEA